MRDFVRDWQRWTRAERITALLVATFLLIGVPALMALNLYATITGHDDAGLRGPF